MFFLGRIPFERCFLFFHFFKSISKTQDGYVHSACKRSAGFAAVFTRRVAHGRQHKADDWFIRNRCRSARRNLRHDEIVDARRIVWCDCTPSAHAARNQQCSCFDHRRHCRSDTGKQVFWRRHFYLCRQRQHSCQWSQFDNNRQNISWDKRGHGSTFANAIRMHRQCPPISCVCVATAQGRRRPRRHVGCA